MPKSSFVNFKAVKTAVTMEQVLEHYGLLDKFKKGGDSLSGPCPLHGGTNPTQFRVSLSKNVFHCFSECGNGGNVLDFIARKENVSIHAAALKAIEWFRLDPESMNADQGRASEEQEPAETQARGQRQAKSAPRAEKPAEENGAANKPLKFRLDKLDRSHAYFGDRGLTLETVVDFGAGYCGKGIMAGYIAIPIHSPQAEVLAYIGRWPGEPPEDIPRYKLPPGFRKSLELFNVDRAIKESQELPLAIVEGVFDCMKLHQHGYRKVVALMGSTMSAAQEELIRRHTTSESRVVVMLDEDDAGRAGRDDIACRLSKFCFVRVHQFGKPDMQPEYMSAEDLAEVLGNARMNGDEQKTAGGAL